MANKVKRIKQQDIINYYGNGIRIEKYDNDDEISIWDETRGQSLLYGRLDIRIKELKELATVLPDFINEIESK